jgi:arylsulfatase A-like enzyme
MIDHDKNVGQMLDLLDQLGIADDTFVMYSTDNGPTWPVAEATEWGGGGYARRHPFHGTRYPSPRARGRR